MTVKLKRVLVTGGGGFLGKHICHELSVRGYEAVSFSRSDTPAQHKTPITCIQGDLTQYEDVLRACQGMDAVIHTAAKAGVWGRYEDFYKTNVIGTQNIIRALKELQLKPLVYTSSPSVVFGSEDIRGGNESLPYPEVYLADYPLTKALAEQAVLKAAREGHVRALALRPHLIWGPGDPHFAPRLTERARQGRLRRVGSCKNMVDVIFVTNAARAHVDALEALIHKPHLSGRAYFIGQEQPVNLWDFVDQLLVAYGEKPLPPEALWAKPVYAVGALLEWVYRRFKLYHREPPMTRFVALQLTKSHFFDHSEAKHAFGYDPLITVQDGINQLR